MFPIQKQATTQPAGVGWRSSIPLSFWVSGLNNFIYNGINWTTTDGNAPVYGTREGVQTLEFNEGIIGWDGARNWRLNGARPWSVFVLAAGDTDNGVAQALYSTSAASGESEDTGNTIDIEGFQNLGVGWNNVNPDTTANSGTVFGPWGEGLKPYSLSYDGTDTLRMFHAGAFVVEGTATVATTSPHNKVFFGGRQGDATQYQLIGALAALYISDGVKWSDAEHIALHQDPWHIWKQDLYVPTIAAAPVAPFYHRRHVGFTY